MSESKQAKEFCNCERPVDHCTFSGNCQVINMQPSIDGYELLDVLRLVKRDYDGEPCRQQAYEAVNLIIAKHGW